MNIDWAAFTPWSALAGGALIGLAAAIFALANGRVAGRCHPADRALAGPAVRRGDARRDADLYCAGRPARTLTWRASIKANVGTLERSLRIAAGLILIALSLAGVIGLWGWIGVLPLATGILRFCPAYPLLGINTCKMK